MTIHAKITLCLFTDSEGTSAKSSNAKSEFAKLFVNEEYISYIEESRDISCQDRKAAVTVIIDNAKIISLCGDSPYPQTRSSDFRPKYLKSDLIRSFPVYFLR